MEIIKAADELGALLMPARDTGRVIGLVPTMGALHAGHLSLVERARRECDVVVASVFVNPTQFNNAADLATYPRTAEADAALLEAAGVDYAFMPTVDEVYPPDDEELAARRFNLGRVAEVLEGEMRPGHFDGVAQVVSRLFDIVEPSRAYFGEKDFQQIAVIRAMVADGGYDEVEIVECPIVRDADGLALSSRNVRLTPEQRAQAPGIHRILDASRALAAEGLQPAEVQARVLEQLAAEPGFKPEYYAIVNPLTLEPALSWAERPRGLATVWLGDVRLIDNIAYA